LASQTQDDGFHEIQLNGKQLVFLFMAATVLSVVIFLCGVLVGRGVRAEREGAAGDMASATATTEVVPDAAPAAAAPVPSAGADPTKAAPPDDDLSYTERLEKQTEPVDQLKTAKAASHPEPRKVDAHPATASASSPAGPPAVSRATAEPAGSGYAVQVAALNDRPDAEAIARRLTGKGYTAYVVAPAAGAPSVYRVRVGKFATRREAEAIATKLKKEEQFSPWITR
jgi:cell division septation protein DedD